MSQHSATFTWPPTGAHSVHVTGSFDNWSGNTFPLHRQDNGWFEGQVPINYGDKVAYKYVVDGQWMTREDEAKEWDAAGNMNNVYTAPHQPAPAPTPAHVEPSTLLASSAPGATTREHEHEHSSAAAIIPDTTSSVIPSKEIDPAVNSSTQAELVAKEHELVGSAATDPVHQSNAPHTTSTIAESSTIESSAPVAAAAAPTASESVAATGASIVDTAKSTVDAAVQKVSAGLDGLNLGAPIGGYGNLLSTSSTSADKGLSSEVPTASDYSTNSGISSTPAVTGTNDIIKGSASMPNASAALAVSPEAPKTTNLTSTSASSPTLPVESTATPATATSEAHSVVESAQAIGAGLFGAVVGGLAVVAAKAGEAVHQATGVDILHTDPVSVEDAKAAGIQVDKLPQVSGQSHGISAVLPPVPAKEFQAVPAQEFLGSVLPTSTTSNVQSSSVPRSEISSIPSPPSKFESAAEDVKQIAPKESFNQISLPSTGEKDSSIVPSSGGTASGSNGDKAVDIFASNNKEKNEKYSTDLPAQHETAKSNHTHVPQPQITTLQEPTKDRTLPSVADAANKPVSSDPGVDPKEAKEQAAAEAAQVTSSGYPLPSTIPFNGTAAEPSRSYIKKEATPAVSGLPLSQTQVPTSGKDAIAPSTPAKTPTPAGVVGAAASPATPNNKRASVFANSPASTAASTPAKSHVKESSAGSSTDVRKRKSSFFAKVKSAFHKDKSEKST